MTDGTATHGWSIGRTAPETFDPRGNDGCVGAQADAAPDAHVAEAGGVKTIEEWQKHARRLQQIWDAIVTERVRQDKLLASGKFDWSCASPDISDDRKPRKVFVCSMTDLFGEWVSDAQIDQVFAIMALTPQHTYQVLTKRPERMRAYLSSFGERHECVIPATKTINHIIREHAFDLAVDRRPRAAVRELHARWKAEVSGGPPAFAWPLPNVWLGTSVEHQEAADLRIPELLACPAAVRFLSCEPLLGPVDLDRYLHDSDCWLARAGWEDEAEPPHQWWCICNEPREDHIDWVIVGGESGPGARPMDVAWARSLVAQCQAAGVPVFVKQLGAKPIAVYAKANDGTWIYRQPTSIDPAKTMMEARLIGSAWLREMAEIDDAIAHQFITGAAVQS